MTINDNLIKNLNKLTHADTIDFLNSDYVISSGGFSFSDSLDSIDIDKLWEKMYVKARSVIVRCTYCGSGNAITNLNCVACGVGDFLPENSLTK